MNMNMNVHQPPTSLEDIEALIQQLYQPGASAKVAEIQETLQGLQKSAEGWQLANALLGRPDQQTKFFGALTYIVKLNTASDDLSTADAAAVLQSLVGWVVQCLENSVGALVLKKLCSTLVTYFLHFSSSWTRCIRHLLYCLSIKEALPYQTIDDAPEMAHILERISDDQVVAMFWFAASIVDEVGKTDSNSMKQNKFHQRLILNVEDVVLLLARYIDIPQGTQVEAKVRQEALRCFQSWIFYSHRAFIDAEIVLEPLRTLTRPAFMALVDDDSLFEVTIELITDVLTNYPEFLKPADFRLLYSLLDGPWAQERYDRLVNGDYDFDSLQFGQFMLAFGNSTVQDLAQNAGTDPESQRFLSLLCGLLDAEGFAVGEDKIYIPALEFWNTFVEVLVDSAYTADREHPSWFPPAQTYVLQAIEKIWRKMFFPPAEVFQSWDSADRTTFKDARRDVSDLLQQSWIVMGAPLFSLFIDLALRSVETKNLMELEASLFCLSQFPDCFADEAVEEDEYLDRIFVPSLFSFFTALETEVPTRAMQTFLTMIGGYAEYFERHRTYLPVALNLVFKAVEFPSMARSASRTISKLCSSCRKILIIELNGFLRQYNHIASLSFLDGHVKEGIMEAIACIIQAIPDEESKLVPLEALLRFVESDLEQCLRDIASNPLAASSSSSSVYTPASETALASLRSLYGIARGLQTPQDFPIDLEAKPPRSSFWDIGKGSGAQTRIVAMIIQACETFPSHGEILEEACHIFRAGFAEHEPGLFVLAPSTIAQFLVRSNFQTPRLGVVMSTACTLISSHKKAASPRIDEVLEVLMGWIAELVQKLGDPHVDPEVAQNGIDFIYRLVPTYLNVLMRLQPPSLLENLFLFTLKALMGPDPLPKSFAADFWSAFVTATDLEDQLQSAVNNVLYLLGPLLAHALVYNIGGNAARSELDKICEPLKKLITSQTRCKNWLEGALLDKSFPSDRIAAKEKIIFLQKVMNLRGARGTNQIVREFWLTCRGSNFAYTS